jgi:triphosphatase
VRRALEAMAASPGPSRSRLVSTYYDTPDRALARRGASLRVRRRGRRFIQTVKAAGRADAPVFARGEWEDSVAGDAPDLRAAESGPHLPPDIAEHLRPLFRTEVSRLTIPLAPAPATRIEAAIDRGRIRNGKDTPPAPISEVELELKSGAPTALYDVALKLLDIAPLRLERRSKAERGYLLIESAAPGVKAVHAEPPLLEPDMTGEAALQCIGRACLDHLLRNEEAALVGDPEGIHQMRVAIRRLRATLSAFAPVLPKGPRRYAASELRWFADVLGDARNLDVFATVLLAPARAALPEASEFERLAVATRRTRRTAHTVVTESIRSTRYTAAILALLRWFDGAEWRAGDCPPDLLRPIGELAPLLLERCRAAARKRAKHFERQSAEQRHRLRITLKKLRYAAELLGGLYDPAETKQFIQRLKRLQDDLGNINDVRVGRDIVEALSGRDARGTGIGHAGKRMLAWHKRRLDDNEPQLRHHLQQLLDAEPFWPQ